MCLRTPLQPHDTARPPMCLFAAPHTPAWERPTIMHTRAFIRAFPFAEPASQSAGRQTAVSDWVWHGRPQPSPSAWARMDSTSHVATLPAHARPNAVYAVLSSPRTRLTSHAGCSRMAPHPPAGTATRRPPCQSDMGRGVFAHGTPSAEGTATVGHRAPVTWDLSIVTRAPHEHPTWLLGKGSRRHASPACPRRTHTNGTSR